MGKSFWIGAIAVAALFFWGVQYVVSPNSGEVEFQKMLEAMKQVKSFRGTYVGSTASTQHSERLWEVDCNRGVVHKQSKELQIGTDSKEVTEDQFYVGSDQLYTPSSDGSWQKSKYQSAVYSAAWYCDNIAQGTVRDLLPDARALLRSATFAKGDKKTVHGVRCRDWNFTNHSRNSGQQGSICIGLDDHLPYEMIVENTGQYSYSDFNRLQFDAPKAVLQAVSSTGGSN
ncbi:MAG TPA: hypothetical protein VKV39_01950 [Candidatus Sulfotelmatobacter sp.]|nr:hypothetical protein [Candidatus Sulfotelmatobacter sp.]